MSTTADDSIKHGPHRVESTADCQHEKGERFQAWSEDGEGYYIWKCIACGWETVDDMP